MVAAAAEVVAAEVVAADAGETSFQLRELHHETSIDRNSAHACDTALRNAGSTCVFASADRSGRIPGGNAVTEIR
jgi:hypothetical protein